MNQKHYYADEKNAQIAIARLADERALMTTDKFRRMNTVAVV